MNEKMIERRDYLEMMDHFRRQKDIIKIITGVRRAGKTTLLLQFRDKLLSEGLSERQVVYLDLEDLRYSITSDRMLYETIESRIDNGAYVLLEGVQAIDGWELAIETVRIHLKTNLYITGSNSKMLSSELGTHLTGRFVEIPILPLSFKEYITKYPVDANHTSLDRFKRYLRWGGMPSVNVDADVLDIKVNLDGVYCSIMFDIAARSRLDASVLKRLAEFIILNIGENVSTKRVAEAVGIRDYRTVDRYLNELCSSFLFYKADRFDIIGRRHLDNNGRFYVADTGLRNTVLAGVEIDESKLLENAVYLELVRRGYRVSVGTYRGSEIGFVAWKSNEPELYKVCPSLRDRSVELELRPLKSIDGRRVVLYIDGTDSEPPEGVKFVNAVDWFLPS